MVCLRLCVEPVCSKIPFCVFVKRPATAAMLVYCCVFCPSRESAGEVAKIRALTLVMWRQCADEDSSSARECIVWLCW